MNVILRTIEQIEDFHRKVSLSNCIVDVCPMNYKRFIDAKSILGIFSLDLSQPIHLNIMGDEEEKKELYEKIKKYEVKISW